MFQSQYYRVRDLVQLTGLPESTIYWRLSVKKDIPFTRLGRTILVSRESWRALMSANSGKTFGRKDVTE